MFFQGPGFSGSECRVRVQILEVALAQEVFCEFCEIGLTSKYKKANVRKCFLTKHIYV